jgi:hypothetical protein
MLVQLDKLAKLEPGKQLDIMQLLFGDEGFRAAANLIKAGGLKGMYDTKATADNQASNEDRMKRLTSTTISKEDAAKGTLTNAEAAIGKPTLDMWNAALDPINSALSSIQAYMANNPGMATRMLYGGTALAGAAVLSTATGQGQALLTRFVPLLSTIVSKTVKGVGVGMLGEIGGSIGVDALTDKDTPANRYGHSIVTGAAYGAGIGSAFGGIGALPGAGLGALIGLMYETVADVKKNGGFKPADFKPRPIEFEKAEIKPLEIKTQVTITVPPGMVVQSKSTTVSGGQAGPLVPKTGNVWDGAPK